jgi:transaldolase
MKKVTDLKIKIYSDGADKNDILELNKNPLIKGFTTNPTLMSKAGVKDYKSFAKEVLSEIKDKDISFEVFADDLVEMEKQALEIASWGKNVYVKIPVINTKGEFTGKLLSSLSDKGVKLNITAIYTQIQVRDVLLHLQKDTPAVISVFCGRMADSGINPIPIIQASKALCEMRPNTELLWASTREVWNVFEADSLGCEIITAPKDVITKLSKVGKTASELTLETVKTFLEDSKKAGFTI